MADLITDEAFDALPLSQQLEFVASHLHEADEASVGNLKCWDISNMLMHCLVMSRKAAALERELQQRRDDERTAKNLYFILQDFAGRHQTSHGNDTPKGAA